MKNSNFGTIILKTGTLSQRYDIEQQFALENVYGLDGELRLNIRKSLLENISPNVSDHGRLEGIIDDLQLSSHLSKLPFEVSAFTRKKAVLAKAVMASPGTPIYLSLGDELTAGEKLLFCGLMHNLLKKHNLSARVFYAKESCASAALEPCA